MDLSILFKRAGQVAAENSPAILTVVGVTGTLTTAYLAAKAAFASAKVIAEAEEHGTLPSAETGEQVPVKFDDLGFKEMTELTWKLYIPAATCAALTVTAIICSNRISERRTAAVAAAYSVAKEGYAEYRKKNIQKIGKKKEQEVRDEMSQDRAAKNPLNSSEIVIVNGGSTLCRDEWSGRYFMSDIESIRSAVNDFNQKIINETYVSMNEFWELLKLPGVSGGSHLGWNTNQLLSLTYSWVTIKDDPCLCIDFETLPSSKYDSVY